ALGPGFRPARKGGAWVSDQSGGVVGFAVSWVTPGPAREGGAWRPPSPPGEGPRAGRHGRKPAGGGSRWAFPLARRPLARADAGRRGPATRPHWAGVRPARRRPGR